MVFASNDHAQQGRLNSLENALDAAQEAVDDGDIEGVLGALEHMPTKPEAEKTPGYETRRRLTSMTPSTN